MVIGVIQQFIWQGQQLADDGNLADVEALEFFKDFIRFFVLVKPFNQANFIQYLVAPHARPVPHRR